MAEELPDFVVTVQSKKVHTGKTLILSLINAALKKAGCTNVEVTYDSTPEYFEAMTPEAVEKLHANLPDFFEKKIHLIESTVGLRESSPEKRLYADD